MYFTDIHSGTHAHKIKEITVLKNTLESQKWHGLGRYKKKIEKNTKHWGLNVIKMHYTHVFNWHKNPWFCIIRIC